MVDNIVYVRQLLPIPSSKGRKIWSIFQYHTCFSTHNNIITWIHQGKFLCTIYLKLQDIQNIEFNPSSNNLYKIFTNQQDTLYIITYTFIIGHSLECYHPGLGLTFNATRGHIHKDRRSDKTTSTQLCDRRVLYEDGPAANI